MPSFDGTDFWECIIQVTNTPFYGDSILVNTSVAFDEQQQKKSNERKRE